MRSVIFAPLLVAVLASAAVAVPVNPNAPDLIAAAYNDGPQVWVLRTNGEVWRLPSPTTGWERPPNSRNDLPLPVAQIADWSPDFFTTAGGERWLLDGTYHTWIPMPPPPFSPVTAQKQSLSGAKQGYR